MTRRILIFMCGKSGMTEYEQRPNLRLQNKSVAISELLHGDTSYPPKSRVLEAGCGVGGQTIA
ncbi:MAG: hypothetical protein AAFV29_25835, partial [Myxococcota bacterium]